MKPRWRSAAACLALTFLCVPAPAMTPAVYLLFFAAGSSRLSPQAESILANFVVNYVRTEGGTVDPGSGAPVVVTGWSDRAGGHFFNLRLSCRRAATTRDYLIAAGIPENIIITRGYGEDDNLQRTEDGVAEQLNRLVRVDLWREERGGRASPVPVRCAALGI